MIQIRRLRTFLDKNGKPVTHTPLFEPDLYAESHEELFAEKLWEKIPEDERYNCFFTVASSKIEQTKREQLFQSALFFDIDQVNTARVTEYLEPIEKALLVKRDDILIINSGHGLHLLLQAGLSLSAPKDYKELKAAYDLICERIDTALRLKDLPGKCDRQVFSPNRMVRLPHTMNHKLNKEEVPVVILSEGFTELKFDLKKLAFGEAEVPEAAQVSAKEFKRTKLDGLSIEKECRFLAYAKDNGEKLSEPEWYGAISILSRLPDGALKCQDYSKAHSGYSAEGTATKIKQALEASGPRTCENISTFFSGCKECPHFGKVKTPLQIKAEDFIASEDDGFCTYTTKGEPIPQYGDLLKFFEKQHAYRVHKDSEQVYIFDKTHYIPYKRPELRQFAATHFKPTPKDYIAKEFISWVTRSNLIDEEWFQELGGYMNFKNGVLKIETGELLPHSPEWGFLYCLPFDFNAKATCPTFDRFLLGVTRQDADLATVILEFIGYALCDREYWLQKSIVFVGRGSNGKTTLLKIIETLVGRKNFSTLSMNDLQNENMRSQLEGKILNICDEFPQATLKNTEMFKKLLGGTVTVRQLYQNPKTITNNSKFFYSCNELPRSRDHSDGYFRRLTIIPFQAQFKYEDGSADKSLYRKMCTELSGIFNCVFSAYQTLCARGEEYSSLQAKRAFDVYRADLNWVEEWFKDAFIVGPFTKDVYLPFTLLHEKFDQACNDRRDKILPRHELFAQLKQFLPDFDERKGQLRNGADRPRVLYGVTLRKTEASTQMPSL